MSAFPLKENRVVFSRHVDWLPDLPVVELKMTCDFKEIPDEEALTRISFNIDLFAKNAKECCLREIADVGIKCKMGLGVEPGRHPSGVSSSSFGGDINMNCQITAMSREDAEDILNVDQLESILRGAMWKQIHNK
jgi:hypothetical protein